MMKYIVFLLMFVNVYANSRIKFADEKTESNEFVNDEEFKLVKNTLVTTLLSLEKTFSVSFKIKPDSYTPGWKNIIHLTVNKDYGNYGDRAPGVWFTDEGSGKLCIASAVNGDVNYYFVTEPIPLNEWSSIKISQTRLNGVYIFTSYVNDMLIHSVENNSPISFQNVKVYVTDPWYDAQEGSIKEIRITNGNKDEETEKTASNEFVKNEEFKLVKNTLITTLLSLEKTFSVSFKIKPDSYTPGWKNIIHLTVNKDYGNYGDRNPGVWFTDEGSGKLCIASAINGDVNYYFITEPIPLNEWSSIKISQTKVNGVYIFTSYVNDKLIHSVENNSPISLQNVKVYVTDPWYDAQEGSIKEIRIKSGDTDLDY